MLNHTTTSLAAISDEIVTWTYTIFILSIVAMVVNFYTFWDIGRYFNVHITAASLPLIGLIPHLLSSIGKFHNKYFCFIACSFGILYDFYKAKTNPEKDYDFYIPTLLLGGT